MGDEERQDITRLIAELQKSFAVTEAKQDMVLVELRRLNEERKDCRANCEDNKRAVWGTLDEMRKVNPGWIYAIGVVVLAIIGIVNLFVAVKGVGH